MRIGFAGTPEFAAVALAALIEAGHDVALVLTQPDRPAGRGMKLQASAVKQLAVQHGIPVAQPRGLRLDGKYAEDAATARQALEAAQMELMVVAAYGLILPQWVLDLPGSATTRGLRGCLNIHGSLLPRWRGAAPIQRAIEAGDVETGTTIMQMDAGLDTGDMLIREALTIRTDDTTASLHDRLAAQGARLVVQALAEPGLVAVPQPAAGVCYAHKIEKAESAIDWRQDAAQIERRLRAFDPFPGGSADLDGELIKVWRAEVCDAQGAPGSVIAVDSKGPVVACGQGALRLLELQRAGAKRMPSAQFLQARTIDLASRFCPNGR